MSENSNTKKKGSKVVIGILFIAVAVLIIVNEFFFGGRLNIFELIIAVGLILIAVYSAKKRMYTGVFFPLAFAYIICTNDNAIRGMDGGTVLLIALLLSIGCHLAFSRNRKNISDFNSCCNNPYREAAVDDSNYVSVRCSFTGVNKKVTSRELKKVEIYSSCAGIMLDLSQATVASDQLLVSIEATLSGIEIYVPADWRIDNRLSCTMAGVEDKSYSGGNGPVMVLEGDLSISGIKIVRV